MTTAPGNLPSAISFFSIEAMRPRRSGDIPTCSGVAVARGWSSRAQTGSDTVVATTIAANDVVALGHASGYRISTETRRGRQRPHLIAGEVKEQRIRE